MSDDRGSGSAVILSFLLGGLTGAALAILFAPRSGEETREMLGGKLREGAERGRKIRDRAAARGREILDDASEYVDTQREALEKRRDRLAAAVDAGRQAFRDEKEKM
ncbi:MAG TPA: YtxH domain-containing protein [Vicinamibacteria bacterium]|jgi:gas vesicle protein|nr:YtxH domain-containing protein [Vicinamibacteria bacterium]